ncbi:MAG: RNA polymerase sigma factor [Planctomycetes bacterium]|nr:RNA polymerase sigma factor [Planctomycetota bacterium]
MPWFGSSKSAIEAMVEAHYVALYRFAYRLSGSAQLAEDLTQETFCLAQKKLHQLREEERAKSWLFAILRNVYLHQARSSKLEKQVSLDGIPEIADRSTENGAGPDSAQLQKALNELPEAFRTPLILYYFEDFSYKEIAEQMNVPLGTVMSRLARGKAFLRQRLTDQSDLIVKANQGEVK